MFLSKYAEESFLNVMRGAVFNAPTQVFCGLFLTSPGDMGNTGTELSYPGYQRMPVTFANPAPVGTGIGIINDTEIVFPQSPTAAGTVRFIGIYDSVTGGNMYLYGQLTEDLPISANIAPVLLISETLFFSIGDLSTAYKTRLFNVVRGQTLSGIEPHCALFNGDPQTGGAELAGNNYERIPLVFTAPAKEPGGHTVIRNISKVNFNRPTTNWGTWSWTAITDSAAGGLIVWNQQIPASMQVRRGYMPFVEAGDITVGVN